MHSEYVAETAETYRDNNTAQRAGSVEPCEYFLIRCYNSKFRRMPFLQSLVKNISSM